MRLIDADALEKKVQRRGAYKICTDDVIAMIGNMPTISAVPVRHGEWIRHGCDEEEFEYYECPLCGFIGLNYNYCPNCGAKMGRKGEHRC